MTSLALDAGALIALDRNDRAVWALLRAAWDAGDDICVPTGAIAQVWRDGARQALLVRALRHCDEDALTGEVARAVGLLCRRASTTDVIDASVVIAAAARSRAGDVAIITSDPDDIGHLASFLDRPPRVLRV